MRRTRKRIKPVVELARFGVSVPQPLLEKFDGLLASPSQGNRSEAIRVLIRQRLAQEAESTSKEPQAATLTMVLDAQRPEAYRRVAEYRAELGGLLLASLHVRLNEREELWVLALRGTPAQLRERAERFLAFKGVQAGKLVLAGGG